MFWGSEGVLRGRNNGAERSLQRTKGAMPQALPPPLADFRNSIVNRLEDLVEAHETGRPTRNHIAPAHQATEICLAVAKSHRQGSARVSRPLENREL